MDYCVSKAMPTAGQRKFLGRLKSLSQEERFCDVQIEFSDGNRKFNSLVLASLSPFFEAMLSSSMKEGLSGKVNLPTVSVEVFDAVMSYYLDGEGELDEKALYEAVDACEMMELPDLKDICILNMKENLSVDNCVRIWQISQKYTEDQKLVMDAFKLIINNIWIVSSQDDFLRLSTSDVFKIISSDRPILMHESLFLETLMKWIKTNEPEEASIKELIGEIRFQLLQETDLLKNVYKHREILKKYKSLDKAIEMYVLNGTTTKPLKEDKRLTSSRNKAIVVCSSSEKPILHVHAWHLGHKKWYDLSTVVPGKRIQFAASSAGPKIVVSVGKSKGKILSETLINDSYANNWEKGPDLNTSRHRHGSVEVNGKVYAVGGQNESFLDRIEMLDIDFGKWELVGNLATPVANPILMTSGKYILVLGGYVMSSKEQFNFEGQCFDLENKSTTVLKDFHVYVTKGFSELSAMYIIKTVQNNDKLCRVFLRDQNGAMQLLTQNEEVSFPYGFHAQDYNQFVVCDGVGYVISSSCTRQVGLHAPETNKVVLPTIPGPVSHVWSGFTMCIADRSLRRVAPS